MLTFEQNQQSNTTENQARNLSDCVSTHLWFWLLPGNSAGLGISGSSLATEMPEKFWCQVVLIQEAPSVDVLGSRAAISNLRRNNHMVSVGKSKELRKPAPRVEGVDLRFYLQTL